MTEDKYLTKEYWNGMIKMSLSRLFILHTLYEEPLHGYEITKRISEITGGCCAPSEGSLYPSLNDFEKEGYLNSSKEVVNGRGRKVYKITEKGRKAYQIGVEAWKETADILVSASKSIEDED